MISPRAIFAATATAVAIAGCSSTTTPHPPPSSAASSTAAQQHISRLSAGSIAHQLDQAGVVSYTAATDPNHLLGRQNGYTSKASWGGYAHTASAEGSGGSVEVFSTTASAQSRFSYLQTFTAPLGDGYDFPVGTAILRLGSLYTPAQAYALGQKFAAIVRR